MKTKRIEFKFDERSRITGPIAGQTIQVSGGEVFLPALAALPGLDPRREAALYAARDVVEGAQPAGSDVVTVNAWLVEVLATNLRAAGIELLFPGA